MRLFFTQPNSLLGIAINASTLSLVDLSFKKQQYHLLSYATVSLGEGEVVDIQIIDTERMGGRIAELVSRSHCNTKQAAIALSTNLAITRYINLPNDFGEQDIEAQIRVDAEQYIPYPLAEVSLDFEVLGVAKEDPHLNEVLLVVSRTEYIEQHTDALIFSGLKPKIVEVDDQAIQRTSQLMFSSHLDYPSTIALVDIGQSRTTVYIAHQGQFVYQLQQLFGDSQLTSAIALHYSLTSDEAEQARLSPDLLSNHHSFNNYDSLIFQPFITTLKEHLTLAFEQYATTETKINEEVGQLILCGRGSVLSQIDKQLAQELSLPVTLVNPFNSMTISASIDDEQLLKDAPQLMTACCLTMRCRTVRH